MALRCHCSPRLPPRPLLRQPRKITITLHRNDIQLTSQSVLPHQQLHHERLCQHVQALPRGPGHLCLPLVRMGFIHCLNCALIRAKPQLWWLQPRYFQAPQHVPGLKGHVTITFPLTVIASLGPFFLLCSSWTGMDVASLDSQWSISYLQNKISPSHHIDHKLLLCSTRSDFWFSPSRQPLHWRPRVNAKHLVKLLSLF
jgi:hypothetical protein